MLLRLSRILPTRKPFNIVPGRLLSAEATKTKKPRKKASKHDQQEDMAVKYTESQAGLWAAEQSRTGPKAAGVWYQPYVIVASLVVFMLYFCVIREENDIDLELQKSLYDRIEGLEETQLRISRTYNLENGLDVKDIDARLRELGAKI
ncbi:uncharacterized protein LOC132259862 [Phlebotomus argentipes]|uniref:uncharacterized protein LOC132259862 n=1 Tax=Phlebotomus argentipes TaxID=94469 RepID=UPI002892A2B8|nr:uncharacterized protein LOC132259862 [Phlebotomus argentipes]